MATSSINGQVRGSNPGAALLGLIGTNDIAPGDGPSYELCKSIYLWHPLGAKIVDKPIEIAQSEKREISITGAGTAADKVRDRFEDEWRKRDGDGVIANTVSVSRIYGAGVLACREKGVPNKSPLDLKNLYKKDVSFIVYDPLNVAGSLVLNQDPLALDFLHVQNVAVSGDAFHRSRARVMFNEKPIYLAWTPASYGYVGRSVYQRALLPLKSFVQTMITDDMVSRKAGVLVAKMKQPGSIINQRMRSLFGFKRDLVQEAEVGNVLSISTEGEEIESIDLKNLAEPFKMARTNIIENIASAVPLPAQMLTEESFGASFHEGSEDAKAQARYIRRFQEMMDPLYEFMDQIIMRLAWTPDFFLSIQAEFPEEFSDVSFEDFFWRCSNSFKTQWPSLLKEPDSELAKLDKIKLEAVIQWVEVLLPNVPQEEKAQVIMWANDQFNELRMLFGGNKLELDYEAIASFEAPQLESPKPNGDQFRNDAVEEFQNRLLSLIEQKRLRVVR